MSPGSMMCTLRSICRTISSMCLSWMVTPCDRYTCWTSSTRCSCRAWTPSTRSFSCGFTEPSVSCWPTSTWSPSFTARRARNETGYCDLVAVLGGDRELRTFFSSSSSMRHGARELGDLRLALGLAGLEQLDHARQAVRDVLAGDAAGVERPHGELRARLADRLRGDDADRLADVDHAARTPGCARSRPRRRRRSASQVRTERTYATSTPDSTSCSTTSSRSSSPFTATFLPATLMSSARTRPNRPVSTCAPRTPRAVRAAHRHPHGDAAVGAAVLLADDELLRHVHQPPGEVPGVGGSQRGVGQSLARAVGGDEVLQHGQALAEVRLDRPRDDLALRVGDEATHAGELADLHDVPARARVGHHVDRVAAR